VRRCLLTLCLVLAACGSDGDANTVDAAPTTSPSTTAAPLESTSAAPSSIAPTTSTTAPSTTTAPTTSDAADTDPLSCTVLTDFTQANEAWRAVNDGVMGGRSEGGPSFADGAMTFAGVVNTNGGGFSSVRALLGPGTLEGATTIRVTGRTDARTYKLVLSDAADGRDRRVSHQGVLISEPAVEGDTDLSVAVVDLGALETSIFGQAVFTEPFEPALAIELGIQIADGIDGPFELQVTQLERCG